MREQLQALFQSPSQAESERPLGFYCNRLCTGLFNVPWERIRELLVGVGLPINVYHPFEPSTRGARPLRVQRPPEASQH